MTTVNKDRPADDNLWNDYIEKASFLIEHQYVVGDIFEVASKLYEKDILNESKNSSTSRT